MRARWLIGDALERMAQMPAGSVDLVLTSPPFLALRSYLPADHPLKSREIGAEPTPADFIDTLMTVAEAARRVLAPHGSLCIELGDTYAGSGGAGGDYLPGGLREGQPPMDGSARRKRHQMATDKPGVLRPPGTGHRAALRRDRALVAQPRERTRNPGPDWPLAKSLCGIPEAFRLSLIYGRNILREPMTAAELLWWVDDLRRAGLSAEAALAAAGGWVAEHGAPRRTEQWRARNVVRWCRPNPPVGALADKFRPGTSDMLVACLGESRYFDLDAVRRPNPRADETYTGRRHAERERDRTELTGKGGPGRAPQDPAGSPPLDWWVISTEAFAGAHYATWPRQLLDIPILSMCPERVCTECGRPSTRIVEVETTGVGFSRSRAAERPRIASGSEQLHADQPRRTLGWSDCGHGSWRRGLVLDPFAGSGTTLAVAAAHGRDSIGIDLDERNIDLARQRVGLWLEVEGEQAREEITVANEAVL